MHMHMYMSMSTDEKNADAGLEGHAGEPRSRGGRNDEAHC